MSARQLRGLLESRPSRNNWEMVCDLAAACDEDELAALLPAVRAWPAQSRYMPGEWWRQWQRGHRRRVFALAGYRYLGDISDVESGTVPFSRRDSVAGEAADFYRGTNSVAVSSGVRSLVLASWPEVEAGCDIVGWSTQEPAALTWFLSGKRQPESATDVRLSPDGKQLIASCGVQWRMWDADSGFLVWRRENDHPGSRFAFSGDGRFLVGVTTRSESALVVCSHTGRAIHRVAGHGPAALDGKGRVLAIGTDDGAVRLHRGDVVTAQYRDCELSVLTAMAFCPRGDRLAVVGARSDGRAVLVTLDTASGVAISRAEVTGFAAGLPCDSALARHGIRLVWHDTAPVLFLPTDAGSALCYANGQTRWADPRPLAGGFTPAADALVTVAEDVEAWLLPGM